MKTRLFVSERLINGTTLTLRGEQARYLGRALRLTVGDAVHLFNGEDGEFSGSIMAVRRNAADVRINDPYERLTESPLRTHLVQGISRGERMDFVVQKATELGVKRISPVLTDHGVVKLDAARAEKRREHWQRVAASACEQSQRIRPPLVDAPVPLNSWFGAAGSVDSTQLILRPGSKMALAGIPSPDVKLCLLIGPEGGFSDREYEDAEAAGFTAVSLGPRVLRTETAALTALAIAQSQWGDLRTQA